MSNIKSEIMSLNFIDFDILIVIFWLLIFLRPIYKAIKKGQPKASDSQQVPHEEVYEEEEIEQIPTRHSKEDWHKTTSAPQTGSLRDIIAQLEERTSTPKVSAPIETPPPLPEKKHSRPPRDKKISKISEKISAITVAEEPQKVRVSTSYKLRSRADLKKAFVWSEIVNRKYN